MARENELRRNRRLERLSVEGIGEWLALVLNEGAKPVRKQGTGAHGTRLGKRMLSPRELAQITNLIHLLKTDANTQPSATARANRLLTKLPFKFVIYPRPGRWPLVRGYPLRKNDYAALAALGALTLAEAFQLTKLRECVGCGRWLFARGNQKACSLECYRNVFYKSREQRERRKLYMRRYRQGEQ